MSKRLWVSTGKLTELRDYGFSPYSALLAALQSE